MNKNQIRNIFVDPPYEAYYNDRLFDKDDTVLNRDNTLEPYIRLKEEMQQQGFVVRTADRLIEQNGYSEKADYYSFGLLNNYKILEQKPNVRMCAFIIFEPPVVAPHLYAVLPELTKVFERVYVHNIDGDGYSLKGVDTSRLRKLYWPQPLRDISTDNWRNSNRKNKIVVINGSHRPKNSNGELYSKRIQVMAELAKYDYIDLYGRGWDRWWSRSCLWLPYWRNRAALISIYKGECDSKIGVLREYNFCLCFENMRMKGYITEKIFDCLYAGVVPIYLGASDIHRYIPESTFIDYAKFQSTEELMSFLQSMNDEDIIELKNAGKNYIRSINYERYYHSLNQIVEQGSWE